MQAGCADFHDRYKSLVAFHSSIEHDCVELNKSVKVTHSGILGPQWKRT
jgi:hypothetical protein